MKSDRTDKAVTLLIIFCSVRLQPDQADRAPRHSGATTSTPLAALRLAPRRVVHSGPQILGGKCLSGRAVGDGDCL